MGKKAMSKKGTTSESGQSVKSGIRDALIYKRVSTDDQKNHGLSLDAQEEADVEDNLRFMKRREGSET